MSESHRKPFVHKYLGRAGRAEFAVSPYAAMLYDNKNFFKIVLDICRYYGRVESMSKRKKNMVLKLNVRPVWAIGTGHNPHQSGSGQHDNSPKRLRTRGDKNRRAIGEGWWS